METRNIIAAISLSAAVITATTEKFSSSIFDKQIPANSGVPKKIIRLLISGKIDLTHLNRSLYFPTFAAKLKQCTHFQLPFPH